MAGFARVRKELRHTSPSSTSTCSEPAFDTKFDVIFCRNVMIDFDRAVQQRVVNALELLGLAATCSSPIPKA